MKNSAKASKVLLKERLIILDEIPDICGPCFYVTLASLAIKS